MSDRSKEAADALISGGPFQGFTEKDFSAYEPSKWSSNAFTLPRRQAKDKLLALARSVAAELGDALGALELHGSDEAPNVSNGRKVEAQWAYFLRDDDTRAALKPLLATTNLTAGAGLFDIALMHQHACLALRLDVDGLAIGFELGTRARVDRDNVDAKLKQSWAKDKLSELVSTLPENTTAAGVEVQDVDSWLTAVLSDERPFRIEVVVSKDDPSLVDAALISSAAEKLSAFLPVYEFFAWSRDNDYAQLKEKLKKTEAERQKKAGALKPTDRVTILSGLLAGKGAVVQEVDQRNQKAKVIVGAMTITVELKDVKPA